MMVKSEESEELDQCLVCKMYENTSESTLISIFIEKNYNIRL